MTPLQSASTLLLCTDMDRTVIPNGTQPEHPQARAAFKAFCQRPNVTLVYVTGRHLALMKEAIHAYGLPQPDYAITDVGTKIRHRQNGRWQAVEEWETEIGQAWGNCQHDDIAQPLMQLDGLTLQESEKQNTHKVSFYADLSSASEADYLARAETALAPLNIQTSLIWSIDEAAGVGLLDVLPQNATKLHAIEFLQQQLDFALADVVFAGDSGNDLPVLTSRIQSVLVANASEDIKRQAWQECLKNHTEAAFFQAQNTQDHNGNYSAGVLQGVAHYAPHFQSILNEQAPAL
ncbi:haloacid dehalogenase [Thiomicrospira sp. XS5]|uniref:HAD-IIB family hydrolase n=1 Tax=Thiomicrospira sp. XS5 TaxID=1775636 RepID=UPI000745F73B|nr:HAD-IIB family hydrolase [Thiomicrospira sp. XS5]KUJ75545.1 haloacid dehalogenase [Thiomicrospira sp. XS5]